MRFEEILVILTFVSGLICLANLILRKKYNNHWLIEYSRSFFPVFVIVLVLRSFLFEPFRIPSGSMKPTLLQGDFVLVNKYSYGVRLPVLGTKLIKVNEPKVGDIIVFRHNSGKDYIKRVVGVPGDHILYLNKNLYINGNIIPITGFKRATDDDTEVLQGVEKLSNITHDVFINPERKDHYPYNNITVPPGSYFVMGDNRDNSQDGRYWGFVEDKDLIGKALATWMSWDANGKWTDKIRWSRIGKYMYQSTSENS